MPPTPGTPVRGSSGSTTPIPPPCTPRRRRRAADGDHTRHAWRRRGRDSHRHPGTPSLPLPAAGRGPGGASTPPLNTASPCTTSTPPSTWPGSIPSSIPTPVRPTRPWDGGLRCTVPTDPDCAAAGPCPRRDPWLAGRGRGRATGKAGDPRPRRGGFGAGE